MTTTHPTTASCPPAPGRRLALAAATAALAAGLLGGCATLNSVDSEVSSYGTWPAGRAPGSYRFERLPSQQARADEQALLEEAARPALQQAGFSEAPEGQPADVTVQLGGRVQRTDRSPWDDPMWWRWGVGGVWGRGWGPNVGLSMHFDQPRYQREVALLIRDRASGQPLYETRASNDGVSSGDRALLEAMFEAALKDFPTPAVSPRVVRVPGR